MSDKEIELKSRSPVPDEPCPISHDRLAENFIRTREYGSERINSIGKGSPEDVFQIVPVHPLRPPRIRFEFRGMVEAIQVCAWRIRDVSPREVYQRRHLLPVAKHVHDEVTYRLGLLLRLPVLVLVPYDVIYVLTIEVEHVLDVCPDDPLHIVVRHSLVDLRLVEIDEPWKIERKSTYNEESCMWRQIKYYFFYLTRRCIGPSII